MNGSPEDVQGLINNLQSQTKIPLLVAANCDSGGDGAVKGGTYISSGAQSEASRDTWVPYHAGLVSAREETALDWGCVVLDWQTRHSGQSFGAP